MQLKRDSDYAFRVLHHMEEQDGRDGSFRGLSISELSRGAGIPRRSAERICGYLVKGQILKESTADNGMMFEKGERWDSASFLDVIKATEGSTDLFAIFDRKHKAYKENERILGEMGNKAREALSYLKVRNI